MIAMTDVTQILNAIQQGDPSASDQLLPLVYDELRILARQRLSNEKPGQTLQATALVHEAYLRSWGTTKNRVGTIAVTSLRQPPRRCGEYWSKQHGGRKD